METKRLLATSEVAKLLDISHKTLIMFVIRNPELKPAEQLGDTDYYLWSDQDIARVRERRAKRKRRTVKKKVTPE